MDVLIYFCGILSDLVVDDLNPDRPPSLLKKNIRFRDVKLSHTQSQTFSSRAILLVSDVCRFSTPAFIRSPVTVLLDSAKVKT